MSPCRIGPKRSRVSLNEVRDAGMIETDPTSPRYDPHLIVMAGVSAIEVFQAEVSIAEWATPMEEVLRRELARDLPQMVPGVRLSRVECRSACCRVTVETPTGALRPLNRAFSILQLADATARWSDGIEVDGDAARFSAMLMYKPPRDADGFAKQRPSVRRMQLQIWRERLLRSGDAEEMLPRLPDD